MMLVVKYAPYAMLATESDIGTQEVVVRAFATRYSLFASARSCTGIRLVTRCVLDKLFIFDFRANNALQDAQNFLRSWAVGVLTTYRIDKRLVFRMRSE